VYTPLANLAPGMMHTLRSECAGTRLFHQKLQWGEIFSMSGGNGPWLRGLVSARQQTDLRPIHL
jgi:phage terminase large subunit-like protein